MGAEESNNYRTYLQVEMCESISVDVLVRSSVGQRSSSSSIFF